jgi:hypothetical protein
MSFGKKKKKKKKKKRKKLLKELQHGFKQIKHSWCVEQFTLLTSFRLNCSLESLFHAISIFQKSWNFEAVL